MSADLRRRRGEVHTPLTLAVVLVACLFAVERNARADDAAPQAGAPRDAQSALFLEVGGAALLYSINYEHRFIPELGLRAGIGAFPLCLFRRCDLLVIVPVSMYGILGEGSHHLELGGGLTLTSAGDKDAQFAVPNVAYRYEPRGGGFLFRAAFTPVFRMRDLSDAVPWGGISVGFGW